MSFIRKSVVKGHTYYQRCESYRENGKVKTRILEHLGKDPNGKPTPREVGKLRAQQETLEAKIKRLESLNEQLESSNSRLLRELKQYSLDDIPRTYKGALQYIELCCDRCVGLDPKKIAEQLNDHGFPAFKDSKWDKNKVKRQFEKFEKPKKQTGKTIDTKAVRL